MEGAEGLGDLGAKRRHVDSLVFLTFLPCVLRDEDRATLFLHVLPLPGSPKGYDKYPASWLYQAFLNVQGLGRPEEEKTYMYQVEQRPKKEAQT